MLHKAKILTITTALISFLLLLYPSLTATNHKPSSNKTDTSLPQDLCICYFLCLEPSSLNVCKALSLTFKSLLKYYLFSETFPEYPIYN